MLYPEPSRHPIVSSSIPRHIAHRPQMADPFAKTLCPLHHQGHTIWNIAVELRQHSLTHHQPLKQWRRVWLAAIFLSLVTLQGCSMPSPYKEQHVIRNLTVIFLDEKSLHLEWTRRTGKEGIQFVSNIAASTGMPALKTIKGFYDYTTQTLYCPKWNFEVCGHELHHAILGQFHAPR